MSKGARIPAAEARKLANGLIDLLSPGCLWLEAAGSLRRGKKDVGDIEIVVWPDKNYHDLTDYLLRNEFVSNGGGWGPKFRKMIFAGVKFDVFTCDELNRGLQFWLRTGPDSSTDRGNTTVMSILKARAPFRVKDGYVWHGDQVLRINTESDWFKLLGLPFIDPARRSARMYRALFADKDHQWGDPEMFYPPPVPADPEEAVQAALFDMAANPYASPEDTSGIDHTGEREYNQWLKAQTARRESMDRVDYLRTRAVEFEREGRSFSAMIYRTEADELEAQRAKPEESASADQLQVDLAAFMAI